MDFRCYWDPLHSEIGSKGAHDGTVARIHSKIFQNVRPDAHVFARKVEHRRSYNA